jgi:hypothetical protein
MRPSQALALRRARIRQIALSHRVKDIRVFGSASRGEDIEGSDLDLLVEPTSDTTLLDIGAIRFELKQLLGSGDRRPDAEFPARQVPRSSVEGGPAGMTRGDPLRVRDYLEHIAQAIGNIREYTAGWTRRLTSRIGKPRTPSFAI